MFAKSDRSKAPAPLKVKEVSVAGSSGPPRPDLGMGRCDRRVGQFGGDGLVGIRQIIHPSWPGRHYGSSGIQCLRGSPAADDPSELKD